MQLHDAQKDPAKRASLWLKAENAGHACPVSIQEFFRVSLVPAAHEHRPRDEHRPSGERKIPCAKHLS